MRVVNINHEGVSIVSSFWDRERLLRSTILAGFAAAAFTVAPTFAQEADDDDDEDEEAESASQDSIVVTGSRIRRDEFTSTSPLQVIDAETVAEAGLVDTAEILRSTPVVQGAQLDASVNSNFVTNGGPGVQNVSLRGLSADRTLLLINGRRMAPAGVEGAPSFPDVNLIPSSIIERVDILLDGASSVYGSDAVTGVINVITRQDYEGLNVEGFWSIPSDEGGEQQRYSLLVGDQGQRGGFTFAFEYFNQENLKLNQRGYNFDPNDNLFCSRDLERDANGALLSECEGSIISRVRVFTTEPRPGGGILFGTDVYQQAGVNGVPLLVTPGWFTGNSAANRSAMSSEEIFRSERLEQFDDVFPSSTRYNFFITGDYDIDSFFGIEGTSFFFEASHSNSRTFQDSNYHGQLFPDVPDQHPLNPFRTGQVGFGVVPIVASPFQRLDVDVELQQSRMLLGMRGDLGFMGAPSWDFESFLGYTRSMGYSSRGALLNERMLQTINTARLDGGGNVVCGTPIVRTIFGFIDPDPCVVVNWFAPSLYTFAPEVGPQFATQAEFDYLAAERTVTTLVSEWNAGGFVTGPVFSLPDGEVQAVLGWEYRLQSLDSGTDTVASQGLAAGFFADRVSRGDVSLMEYYGEASFPLLQGRTFAEELTLDVAARLTDHEFYGQNSTWSVRGSWSPSSWLTFRGTAGTSFRAPNLRELFLGGQTGFTSGFADPCVVPPAANNGGVYDPTQDNRSPTVIANCQAEGVNPFTLGLTGVTSIESFRAGNRGLQPETSDAISLGFVVDQQFTDAFNFTFGVNYFEIRIDDAVAIPGTTFALNRCYNSTNFPNDPFCARRTRDPATGAMLSVDNTPFNVATQTSEGFDMNARFSQELSWLMNSTFQADAVFTYTTSVTNQTTSTSAVSERAGTIAFPEWRGTMNARIINGDWTFFWRGRYIGEQPNLGVFGPSLTPCELAGCVAANGAIDDVDAVLYHDLSVNWASDTWSVRLGVNNVANEDPPLVDQNTSDATLAAGNVPLGVGYDMVGRRFFINVAKRF